MAGTENSVAKRRVLRGGVYLSLGPVSALFLGFIVNFIIGIYIPPETLGEFSFINEFINMTTTIGLFGLPAAITKYLSENIGKQEHQTVDAIKKTNTILSIGLGLLSLVFTLIVTPIFFELLNFELTLIKQVLISLTTVTVITSNLAISILRGYYDVERIGLFDLIASIISRLVVIFCILVTFDIYSMLLRFIITGVILLSMVFTSSRKPYKLEGETFSPKKLFTFGLPGTTAFAVGIIGQNLLLKGLMLILFSQTDVGYFDFAFRLSNFINTITIGFFSGLTAYYSRLLGEGGEQKIISDGGWIFKTSLFIFSPVIIGSIAVSKVFFEDFFLLYFPAFSFFLVLNLRLLVLVPYRVYTHVLDSVGKTNVKLISKITSIPLGYLTLLVTYPIGPLSIAISWSVMEIIGVLTLYFFSEYYVKSYVPNTECSYRLWQGTKEECQFYMDELAKLLDVQDIGFQFELSSTKRKGEE